MEVARFVKSNLKLLIVSLSIIQAVLISYICFIGSENLTLKDFLQLVPAVMLAIWILPWSYNKLLSLKFATVELKQTLKDENANLMVSPEELKQEAQEAQRKFVIFSMFALCFVAAEFAYICKYVYNTPIKNLIA